MAAAFWDRREGQFLQAIAAVLSLHPEPWWWGKKELLVSLVNLKRCFGKSPYAYVIWDFSGNRDLNSPYSPIT
jgi:hypothetical protein